MDVMCRVVAPDDSVSYINLSVQKSVSEKRESLYFFLCDLRWVQTIPPIKKLSLELSLTIVDA